MKRGLLAPPSFAFLVTVALAAALAGGIALAPPYARWVAGGPCAPHGPSSIAEIVVGAFFVAPVLGLFVPLRPRAAHAAIVLFAGVALFLPVSLNVVSNISFARSGDAAAAGPAMLLDVALSILYASPVAFVAEIRRERLAPTTPASESWERVLAAAGVWVVVAATLTRVFSSAQAWPLHTRVVEVVAWSGAVSVAAAAALAAARWWWLRRVYEGRVVGVSLMAPWDAPASTHALPFVGDGPYDAVLVRETRSDGDPYRAAPRREALARIATDRERGVVASRRVVRAALVVLVVGLPAISSCGRASWVHAAENPHPCVEHVAQPDVVPPYDRDDPP